MALLAFNLLAGAALPAAPAGDPRVICTAHGFQAIDRTGTPASNTAGGHDLCVFCLPLMHGGADAPALAVFEFHPISTGQAVALSADFEAPVVRPVPHVASPRAPPSV